MSDELVFANEQYPAAAPAIKLAPWVVLIVDDEPAVHEVTKLVMSDFTMEKRSLEFLHCYSGAEAKALLGQRDDIALILLDVVMETEHAGLEVARYIREELHNLKVRIVLRTGQPGQAPEERVIRDYDINDYKEKTELTRRKLMTVFYASLRAYRDLMRIELACAGLRRSIEAITKVSDSYNLRTFASAVLGQLNFLLDMNGEGLCASRIATYTASAKEGQLRVLAATEAYSQLHVDLDVTNLPPEVSEAIALALSEKQGRCSDHHFTSYYRTKAGNESIIYMLFSEPITASAQELLEVFSSNVAITYDGLLMREEIEISQRATISILGEAIERRSTDSGAHVMRVGEIAALLASKAGMSDSEVELIRLAAPLHDVGKVQIMDQVLQKPGPLNEAEWNAMKDHTLKGYSLLSSTHTKVHQFAAIIAREHHEHWDGSGYPRGLAGEDIHLAARITAIADVLDSLLTPSFHKNAWEFDAALAHIRAESGKHFEPRLVTLALAHLSDIKRIYSQLPIRSS